MKQTFRTQPAPMPPSCWAPPIKLYRGVFPSNHITCPFTYYMHVAVRVDVGLLFDNHIKDHYLAEKSREDVAAGTHITIHIYPRHRNEKNAKELLLSPRAQTYVSQRVEPASQPRSTWRLCTCRIPGGPHAPLYNPHPIYTSTQVQKTTTSTR